MRQMIRIVLLSFLIPACNGKPNPKEPWYPHVPTAWTVTPGGHTRDAGPFSSVSAGWTTEAEIDQAIDNGYARYAALFPDYPVAEYPVTLNDDYTLWAGHTWASGMWQTGSSWIRLSLWTRKVTSTDPGPAFIARPPGTYWGVYYQDWRHTALPLCPALAHELLHTAIGDPNHESPLWQRFNGSSKAGGLVFVDCRGDSF